MTHVDSCLVGSPGQTPSIVVSEERKGTAREVQTISIDAGGGLEMKSLKDILALPVDGSTCLGSTKANRIITNSTFDTFGVAGGDSVLHLTSFELTYQGYTTSRIMTNAESCEDTSNFIACELMRLPPLDGVNVTGIDTAAGEERLFLDGDLSQCCRQSRAHERQVLRCYMLLLFWLHVAYTFFYSHCYRNGFIR